MAVEPRVASGMAAPAAEPRVVSGTAAPAVKLCGADAPPVTRTSRALAASAPAAVASAASAAGEPQIQHFLFPGPAGRAAAQECDTFS